MSQKFKTGDRVELISGSPSMTVTHYEPTDGVFVTCQWFAKDDIRERSFHQDTLQLWEAPPPLMFYGSSMP